jgi:hypothetical protein
VPRGFSVPLIDGACTDAGDCPSLDEYDNVIDLDCAPGDPTHCSDPDLSYSSRITYALFGERYDEAYSDTNVRKAVLVAYCHRVNDDSAEAVSAPDDFAYCVLVEEPNVQPVHPMMHCEADLHLSLDTPVTGVGFGLSNGVGGTKRTATSLLNSSFLDSDDVVLQAFDAWTPGSPQQGDSGGPLLVRLPDLTWRVAGVASDDNPTYATVWPHMAWLASDPNVDIAEVIPCHDTSGTWVGGPGCTGFPSTPASRKARGRARHERATTRP